MKRITTAMLLIAMLAGMTACGGTPASTDTTAAGGDTTAPAVTSPLDALPQKNYGGEDFTIFGRTKYAYEFEAEEENGDLLNDALYKRNITVEDRYGVNINMIYEPCTWGAEADAWNAKLKNSILAGDGAFDLVAGYAATIPAITAESIFINWHEVPSVNPEAAWWSKNVAEQLTINGKAYMITGDAAITLWQNMNCFYYNKRLADEYKLPDMYELVESGSWTFDKLIELTADVYKDLDGDTKASAADAFGLSLRCSTETDMLKEAFNLPVCVKGADGFPEFALKSEKMVDALTRINQYVHESGVVYFPWGEKDVDKLCSDMFNEGRAIFFPGILSNVETYFRDMKDDFGIIPYPKYDTKQSDYYSSSKDELSVFVVPVDVKDTEKTGIITEALCIASNEMVVPTYYEIVLKDKMSRDAESTKMIDIIRDSLIFDFGYLHSNALGGVGHVFVGRVRANANDIVSTYDSKEPTYLANLEKLMEVYK